MKIEDYNLDAIIEAKMWLLSNTGREELLEKIDSYDNNAAIFKLFGAETEEDIIATLGESFENLNYDINDWFVDANRRYGYSRIHKSFYENTQGFPIDVACLYKILNNRFKICLLAAAEANQILPDLYSLSKNKKFINRNDAILYDEFPEMKDDSVSDIFDSLRGHPHYDKLYLANSTIRSLMGKVGDKIQNQIINNFFVKGGVRVLESKTGRDNPKPSEGFILGCHTWIRHIIKPRPGKAFLKFDWVAQEPWVAGILTGDQELIEGYKSRDLYSYVGKKLGLMPQHGDKHSFPKERSIAKDLQLAISYGQSEKTLSKRIENGAHLYKLHKERFTTYWSWVNSNITECKKRGYYRSRDGWFYYVNRDTKRHLLYNAPFQIEAAGMMREFVLQLDKSIDLVATHFDAAYVNCDEDDAEEVSKKVIETMNNAAMTYFNTDLCPVAEPAIFTSPNRYTDPRGTEFFNKVTNLIYG